MSERLCPTCNRPWPREKGRRFCVACKRHIGKHDHWFTGIMNQPQHYDCEHPTADPKQPRPADNSLFVNVSYLDGQGKEVPAQVNKSA